MKIKLLTLGFLLFLIVVTCKAQILHGIILANTQIDDIGKSCETDMIKITVELNSIAKAIGYEPKLITISEGSFNFSNLNKSIHDLKAKPNDIIIFYYSGHGFNKNESKSKWPIMHLNDGAYPLEKAHDAIKKTGARLIISIGDCCNLIADPFSANVRGYKVVESKNNNEAIIYKHLFIDACGDILISGCELGQCSYGTSQVGGFFTAKLIESLHTALNYANEGSWYNLLEDAKNKVENINFEKKQVPQYSINLHSKTNPNFNNKEYPNTDPINTKLISYATINKFMSSLSDSLLSQRQKLDLLLKSPEYFNKNAKVNIYVNSTLTEVQTIEDFFDRLIINCNKILTVNLIENKSKLDSLSNKFKEITVQEIWKK